MIVEADKFKSAGWASRLKTQGSLDFVLQVQSWSAGRVFLLSERSVLFLLSPSTDWISHTHITQSLGISMLISSIKYFHCHLKLMNIVSAILLKN